MYLLIFNLIFNPRSTGKESEGKIIWCYPRKTLNSKIPRRLSDYISPLSFAAYSRKLNAYFTSLAFKIEVTVCYFLYKYHLFYFLCYLHEVLKVKSFPDGFWLLNKPWFFKLNVSAKKNRNYLVLFCTLMGKKKSSICFSCLDPNNCLISLLNNFNVKQHPKAEKAFSSSISSLLSSCLHKSTQEFYKGHCK